MSIQSEPTKHRIVLLDVLRGLALFGILVVNMEYFGQTVEEGWARPEFSSAIDRAAVWLIIAFLQMKAYLLFALLFGYGLGLQLEHRRGAQRSLVARHTRRMMALLLIGVVHAVLLFPGDILVTYAIIGMLCIPFWHVPSRPLLYWAAGGYALCVLIGAALIVTLPELDAASLGEIRDTYATGTFADVTAQRVRDLGLAFPFVFFLQGPMAFVMFLVGIVMARKGILTNPQLHAGFLRRIVRGGLPVGLLGGIAAATLTIIDPDGLGGAVGFILQLLTAPALSLAYVGLLGLLFAAEKAPRWLLAERHPGRMSLTVYVGESLLAALVFTSLGFGLFGQLGPAASVLVTFPLWAICLAFSFYWMQRYRFGPLEWLLRSATYLRRQPLRIRAMPSRPAYPRGKTTPSTRTQAPRSPE